MVRCGRWKITIKTLIEFERIFFFVFSEETRSALLNLCLKDVNLATGLDTNQISDKLIGFTGSDITNVCR